MKKILFILVLLQIITTSAFGQDGKPILKSEWCGKITGDQYVTAIENGDPDGIFNCTTTELKKTFKDVLNWDIEHKWKDQNLNPIVTDQDLYSSLRACFSGLSDASFKKGERLIGYVAEDGTIKFKAFRSNYAGEESYKYSGFDIWSQWCGNPFADLAFLGSTGTVKKDAVVASANGQPIIINNYVYAGNNNGNGNGGDALALSTAPAADNAVDASVPAPVVYQPPAPRYDPPAQVVYQQPQQPVVYQTGPAPSSGGDCPECKKGVPAWVPVATAAGGVVLGYFLNEWIGNGSSGGTYYGTPTGYPVDVNGGNPVGPGGPVDIPGGPVDISGGG